MQTASVPAQIMVTRAMGRTDYEACWRAMRAFTDERSAQTPDEIWLTEHPPIYTLGLAGRREHLLRDNGIPVLKVDRGGQVTYHGPGQLVAYTLFDLAHQTVTFSRVPYDAMAAAAKIRHCGLPSSLAYRVELGI